jgi:hypothetical protein
MSCQSSGLLLRDSHRSLLVLTIADQRWATVAAKSVQTLDERLGLLGVA